MRRRLVIRSCAFCAAIAFLGALLQDGYARGRGGGGRFAHGGVGAFGRSGANRFAGGDRLGHGGLGRFSREGPAAFGGFASHASSMQGWQHTGQASRQQYGESAQASRQQEANRMQSSREGEANTLQ